MDWKLFVARRIYRSKEGNKEVSKPAVLIATWGIAVGLAVMILSVAVVVGFKHEVRGKVVGLGSDITVTNFDAQKSYETVPVVAGDSLLDVLRTAEGVSMKKYKETFGTSLGEDFPEALKKSVKYLELNGDNLRIKDEYLYVQNSILMPFIEEIEQ